MDWRKRTLEPGADFEARFLHLVLDQRERLLNHAVQIDGTELGARRSREVQQAVDDFAGPKSLFGDFLEHARFLLILRHLLGKHLRVTRNDREWRIHFVS